MLIESLPDQRSMTACLLTLSCGPGLYPHGKVNPVVTGGA
jgi:hypothetical protein